MKKKNRVLARLIAAAVVVAVAVLMFIIGRGHTVYFDSKSGDYEGTAYTAPYKMEVYVDGERVAKLKEGERGMASTMGQSFKFTVEVTEEKGGDAETKEYSLSLPYSWDGIVVNVPALAAGLPEEAWESVFVPAVTAAKAEDEEVVTDEFAGLMGDEEEES